jgi:hypothetical protein
LDKSGDTIELKYPDDSQPDGEVPYDRMDQVTYEDGGLWPKTADGFGASLNRISATAYGNDAANWTAAQPTPGTSTMNMVVSSNPSTAGPTSADSLTFTVVFNASVVNVSSDDFLLTSTGTAAGTIVGVTPSSGTSFTVTVGSIIGDGALRLDLKNGTNVRDVLGNMAYGYTAGGAVSIDNTAPTSSIVAVTPSLRLTALGSIAIQFSETVAGFNLADLQLTRDGLSVSLSGATLTTTDQKNWTLGNLTAVTSPVGIYQLALTAAGSGISDAAGNQLIVGASTVWRIVPPIPGDFNLDGVVDGLDKAIWFANAFTGTTWVQGDANGDGTVNGLDRDILYANLGRSIFTEYPDPALAPAPNPGPKPAPRPAPVPLPAPTPKNPAPVGIGGVVPAPANPGTPVVPSNPVGLTTGVPTASPSAAMSTSNTGLAANTAMVQAAVTVTQSGNSAAASLSGAQQASLAVASVLYVGTGPGTPPNLSATLAAGFQTLPCEQSQPASTLVAQTKPTSTMYGTNKSAIPAVNVPLATATLQAARDTAICQIEEGRSDIIDRLFADEKAGTDEDLTAAGLDLRQLGVSATSRRNDLGGTRDG